MKKIFTKLFLICFLAPLMAQDKGTIENSNFRMFELIQETDTINFIKIPSDITETKPVLLVLQGSLPIPLGIKYPQGISYTSFPYQLSKEIRDKYHIVAISMPDIPVIVEQDQITNRGTYIDIPTSYNKKNYLQNYVNRANLVINYLSEQSWVQQKQFFLFGHSQGSYVAIKLAKLNPHVSKIGVSALSPNGRFQQYLSNIRYEEHSGKISSEEAQLKIEDYYARWKHIAENRDDDSQDRGDTFKATFSFSENFVDDILKLKIPIYITYGTKDIGTLGCDILPIEFAKIGKTDYKLKAYPGLGHNFEEIDENGQSNFDKMHWDEVFTEFMKWLEE